MFSLNSIAQTADKQEVKQFTLSNGLNVWINEDHSIPKVIGAVVVKAGAADCPNTGIAHYFEHIMFKGTDKLGTIDYPAEKVYLDSIAAKYDELAATKEEKQRAKIQAEINRLNTIATKWSIPNEFTRLITQYGGTGLNAYTAYDETVYHNEFSPQYIRQWAWLNSERLINPVFRLFQGELETVYEEKNRASDNLIMGAFNALTARVMKGTPYAYPIIGSTENLKNPKLSEMETFFKKYYVAGNMTLVLCGDIKADSLQGLLEETFGRIPRGDAPKRPVFQTQRLDEGGVLKLKLPIPLIKAGLRVFMSPLDTDKDHLAAELIVQLLTNESKSGLLDSLVNNEKIMQAVALRTSMKDFAAMGFLVVPNIPFASRAKAERLCMAQIERIKRGDFSEKVLEQLKNNYANTYKLETENMEKRAALLYDLAAKGMTWQDYLDQIEQLETISKADIMRVAKEYLNENCLQAKKVFGNYPVERLKQPGYKPVSSPNINARSEMAQKLESMDTPQGRIRTIDIARDAALTQLFPHARLFTVKNPSNDIASLQLIYRKGIQQEKKLEPLAEYLTQAGTSTLKLQELGNRMREIGMTLAAKAYYKTFEITVMVPDKHFDDALKLLAQILQSPKATKKNINDIAKAAKLEDKTLGKSIPDIYAAVEEKVIYGDQSLPLHRLTGKETATLNENDYHVLLNALRTATTDVVYTGRIPMEQIINSVKEILPLRHAAEQPDFTERKMQPVKSNIIYYYPVKNSRQNNIALYIPQPSMPTVRDRAIQSVLSSYIGGDMNSVLFQEVRELRSLAYSTYCVTMRNTRLHHKDFPTALKFYVGTQADKTMTALALLDSLKNDLPLRDNNIIIAKKSCLNSTINEFPTFRRIGTEVANLHNLGYTEDPAKEFIDSLQAVTPKDVCDYYKKYVQSAAFATIIVGNLSSKELEKLRAKGQVVILKETDVWKK